jgi:hypothetical protein
MSNIIIVFINFIKNILYIYRGLIPIRSSFHSGLEGQMAVAFLKTSAYAKS